MFCENCGHQNNDSAKFCENCGAPLTQAQSVTGQQYDTSQPYAQGQQYDPYQQYDQGQQYDPNQQFAEQPNAFDQAPAQKKQMSSKTKKIILFSSIGVAVLAAVLIVLFAVVIPAVNRARDDELRVDMTKYLTVKVNGVSDSDKKESVFEGKISGSFAFDSERLSDDKNIQPARAASLFTRVRRFMTIEYSVLGKTENSPKFANASENDIVTVTYKWPDDKSSGGESPEDAESIRQLEEEYGVAFRHENKTCEYQMSNLLSEAGVTVKKPVEFDLLGYIEDNKLIFAQGARSGRMRVGVKPFEAIVEGITFSLKEDSYYVSVKSGDTDLGSVELEFDHKIYLDDNQIVTLDYDVYQKERLENKGVILKGEPIQYTVKVPEPTTAATTAPATTAPATKAPVTTAPATTAPATTAPETTAPSTSPEKFAGFTPETAKSNVEGLKKMMVEKLKDWEDNAKKGDNFEVAGIYYSYRESTNYRRMVFICHNTAGGYYKTVQISPEYLKKEGSKVVYDSTYNVQGDNFPTAEKAKESHSLIKSTAMNLEMTKIL